MPIPKTGNDSLDQYLNTREIEDRGNLTKQGFLVSFPSFPTASKDHRGRVAVKYNGAGVADEIKICRKKADDTYEWVDIANAAPPGAVQAFARSTPPAGWLECNGAAVSRTTYADLFAAIGTTFGVGDGTTTFNLPDLRGEFIRGWDNSRGVDSGRTFGSWQADVFKSHNHEIKGGNAGGSYFGGVFCSDMLSGSLTAVQSTGGSETRPRNVALMYCIKT